MAWDLTGVRVLVIEDNDDERELITCGNAARIYDL